MKTKLAALALTVAFSAPALAEECTAELAQAKSMEVNAGLQKLAAKDPQRMQEVATEMMEKSAMFENIYGVWCEGFAPQTAGNFGISQKKAAACRTFPMKSRKKSDAFAPTLKMFKHFD